MPTTVEQFTAVANGNFVPGQTLDAGGFLLHASPLLAFGDLLPPWWSRSRVGHEDG